MKPASLRLPDEISQRLNRLADRTGRSKTFYMQAAILEYLDDLEDLYLAEQRLIDIQAGEVSGRATRRSNGTLWLGR